MLKARLFWQCGECGLRFASAGDESRKHADWHFAINRRDKRRLDRPAARQWFPSAQEWSNGNDGMNEDIDDTSVQQLFASSRPDAATSAGAAAAAAAESGAGSASAALVPSDEDQTECPVCSEPFDEVWSEKDDQWMYRGAKLNEQGKIVHINCA